MSQESPNRRTFLKSAALAAGPALVSARGANDKVNVGWIGVGTRGSASLGWMHTAEPDNVAITAVCDTYQGYIARAKDIMKTTWGTTPKTYTDYRDLLADKDIDAVFIMTPEHLHHDMAIAALKAGKHVYVEKPLAHTIEEGFEIVKAWEDANKKGYTSDGQTAQGTIPTVIVPGEDATGTPGVLDACPTRDQARVHDAIRALLERMNIRVAEPAKTRTKGTCCGDSFYGVLPVEQVKEQMKRRSKEMPCEDVAVYCVSCCKAMHIGGRTPRYLVDLLFEEETPAGIFEPDEWHGELDKFIDEH